MLSLLCDAKIENRNGRSYRISVLQMNKTSNRLHIFGSISIIQTKLFRVCFEHTFSRTIDGIETAKKRFKNKYHTEIGKSKIYGRAFCKRTKSIRFEMFL